MIDITKSYKLLKVQQQEILDFSVLIGHSIPNLKKMIKGETQAVKYFSVPNPDFFQKETNSKLLEIASNYKKNLAKYLLISSFSFFEIYFKSVVRELLDFHGGDKNYFNNVAARNQKTFDNSTEYNNPEVKKLKEFNKKSKKLKYRKAILTLESNSQFIKPSEALSSFGIKYLSNSIKSEFFRSYIIPEILEDGFLMDLSDQINSHPELKELSLKETFNYMREIRNKISHGEKPNIGIEKVIDLIRFLKKFSRKIDNHLLKYFFIIENE